MLPVWGSESGEIPNSRPMDASTDAGHTAGSSNRGSALQPSEPFCTPSDHFRNDPRGTMINKDAKPDRHLRFTGTMVSTKDGTKHVVPMGCLNGFFDSFHSNLTEAFGESDRDALRKHVRDMFCPPKDSNSTRYTSRILPGANFDHIWDAATEALDPALNNGTSANCIEFGDTIMDLVDITEMNRDACVGSLARIAAHLECGFLQESEESHDELLPPTRGSEMIRTDNGVSYKEYWGPGWRISVPI